MPPMHVTAGGVSGSGDGVGAIGRGRGRGRVGANRGEEEIHPPPIPTVIPDGGVGDDDWRVTAPDPSRVMASTPNDPMHSMGGAKASEPKRLAVGAVNPPAPANACKDVPAISMVDAETSPSAENPSTPGTASPGDGAMVPTVALNASAPLLASDGANAARLSAPVNVCSLIPNRDAADAMIAAVPLNSIPVVPEPARLGVGAMTALDAENVCAEDAASDGVGAANALGPLNVNSAAIAMDAATEVIPPVPLMAGGLPLGASKNSAAI